MIQWYDLSSEAAAMFIPRLTTVRWFILTTAGRGRKSGRSAEEDFEKIVFRGPLASLLKNKALFQLMSSYLDAMALTVFP